MSHLVVNGVDVRFDDTEVLRGAHLSVDQGEVVALLGSSGSGKTTLLRVIAGIVHPDAGTVTLAGDDITNRPTHRRGVGLVFQDNQLFPHLSTLDNVAFGLKMAGVDRSNRRRTADEWLTRVDLHGFGQRPVAELSGGEAKRVALARTLAPNPAVVLLDEPLTGLDRELHDRLASEVRDLLAEQHITAVLVTHDRDEADVIAGRSVDMAEINGGDQ